MFKCGLEQPSCDRCLKHGLKCSGPSNGQIFIRRDISNIQDKSDREMLKLAIRNCDKNTPASLGRSLQAACRFNNLIEHPSPLSAASSLCIPAGLYPSVIKDFRTISGDPAKNSLRGAVETSISICGQLILQLTFRNRALDAAIFCASTMYLGRVRGDADLRKLAMSAYPTALCLFRSELTSVFELKAGERYHKDLVMAILLCLLVLEVSSPSARNISMIKDYSIHKQH
jgi:hypothetical protein